MNCILKEDIPASQEQRNSLSLYQHVYNRLQRDSCVSLGVNYT